MTTLGQSFMINVYSHFVISQVRELHRHTIALFPEQLTLPEFLERQARTLFDAQQSGDERVCCQISNWNPKFVGAPKTAILNAAFSLQDARITLAREHSFADWEEVLRTEPKKFDPGFERCVNAIVTGDLEFLNSRVDRGLVCARSPFGHHSTLLHYAAANGVETWRQTVPQNAPEIVRLLLEKGADVNATADMYGGGQTTMGLLVTSAHPAEAGLTDAVAAILREAGG